MAQRLIALALGYEDLNDHDRLRADPLLALCVGKSDLPGEHRLHDRDKALASSATLNRLEVGSQRQPQYHKIHADFPAVQETLLNLSVSFLPPDTDEVVLDFDNSDNPLHGEQIRRFFHGYYENYCYLPLYCFADNLLLWAELLPADEAPVNAMIQALPKIVAAIRKRFPDVRIIIRCDSGFCREELFALCEDPLHLSYAVGTARPATPDCSMNLTTPFSKRGSRLVCVAAQREFSEPSPIERRIPGPHAYPHRQGRGAWRQGQSPFYRH